MLKQEPALLLESSFYHFVPYKYGPYSFTVYRDLEELGRFGFLNGNGYSIESSLRKQAEEAYESLTTCLRESIEGTLSRYGRLSQESLIDHVYRNYPWFASRSELPVAPRITERAASRAVYTAGYEGESIDLFLGKLLKARIKQVVDVRSNPVSRKYGFAKRTLQRLCAKIDIEYAHLPELGIPPSKRTELNTFEDYQKLMTEYERSILPEVPAARRTAARLLKDRPSALVCFEADVRCCHRGRLAQALSSDTNYKTVHL